MLDSHKKSAQSMDQTLRHSDTPEPYIIICKSYIHSFRDLFSTILGHCLISSGERPTLPALLRLKIPQQVGDDYSTFGIFLLDDETGSRVDAIEETYSGKPERITRKILQEWIEGKGLPLTWESLIKTLRDTGLSTLADEIAAKKLQSS